MFTVINEKSVKIEQSNFNILLSLDFSFAKKKKKCAWDLLYNL